MGLMKPGQGRWFPRTPCFLEGQQTTATMKAISRVDRVVAAVIEADPKSTTGQPAMSRGPRAGRETPLSMAGCQLRGWRR